MFTPAFRSKKGFSLIEVLVAAAIVGLSVFAVVAMVRKGQQQITLNQHRSEARGIVQRTLEAPRFAPENYGSLVTDNNPAPQDVVIDNRTGLHGFLTIQINAEQLLPAVAPLATGIPYRAIVVTVNWTENAGMADSAPESVEVRKRLCNVQRE